VADRGVKYNVLPLDDRTAERLDPAMAGRPDADPGHLAALLPGHGAPVGEQRRQHQEQVVLGHRRGRPPAAARERRDHRPGRPVRRLERLREGRQAKFAYNVLGIHEFATTVPTSRSQLGKHQVRMEFAYDGGGLAKGGDVTLYYDGEPVGSGPRRGTQPMVFSADETTDIGYETGTPVSTTTPHGEPSSPAGSTGCRSTWAPTTTTTSSTPRSAAHRDGSIQPGATSVSFTGDHRADRIRCYYDRLGVIEQMMARHPAGTPR
jgi:hypothetical protein